MDKSYELKYHKMETDNWWFVARRDFIKNILKRADLTKNAKILEIGCSGGPLLGLLKKEGYTNVQGIDNSDDAIKYCRKNGVDNVSLMDGVKTKFADCEFDLIIASDILEHIQDDISALVEWRRILKPGGKLIVFVPAFQFLWSTHDKANLHYRRYSKKLLVERIVMTNFKIQKISYWNFVLFFPTTLVRTLLNIIKKNESKDQLYKLNFIINAILIALLGVENFVLRYMNFPIGVSLFVVCRK